MESTVSPSVVGLKVAKVDGVKNLDMSPGTTRVENGVGWVSWISMAGFVKLPTLKFQEFGRTDASGDDRGVLGRQLSSGSCWVGVGVMYPHTTTYVCV